MLKTLLLLFTILFCVVSYAQNGFLIVKKKNKTVRYFGKDSRLTFQLNNGQWITGFIDRIERDSFYYTQEIIRYYTIGTDTLRYRGLQYALSDISALPSAKQQYYFRNDQVYITNGNEKFVWARNGFILQLAGGGYAGLNIVNDLYRKERPFAGKNLTELGIAAAVFMVGTFLHMRFDPFIRPGKKYKLELVSF